MAGRAESTGAGRGAGTHEESSLPLGSTVSKSPKLTKKTVFGPKAGACGLFQWDIQWELTQKTAIGGLVVQKSNMALDVKYSNGNPYVPPVAILDPSWFPFWEAWVIPKNENTTKLAGYDDRFRTPGRFEQLKGSYALTGVAEFFEGAQLAKTNLKVTNKPPAESLPMSKSDPALKGGSGAIPHNLKATWNCTVPGHLKTGITALETA